MRTWGLLAAASAPYGLAFITVRARLAGTRVIQPRFPAYTQGLVEMGTRDNGDEIITSTQGGLRGFIYAYCHGFLSGPGSVKGQTLREAMLEAGVEMTLLNLNGADNDPGAITCSGALQAVRDFHQEKKVSTGDPNLKLRLVGSSLGGFVVSRYADLYPDEVDRIFMLCPSFCLASRAPKIVSKEEMAKWKQDGSRVFPLSTGGEATVPFAFVEDALTQPDYPGYVCPAALVHGIDDEVVPVESTRALVEGRTELARRTSALFVEDDHALIKPSTLNQTIKSLIEFCDLADEDTTAATAMARGGEGLKSRAEGSAVRNNVEVEAKFLAENLDDVKEAIKAQGGVLVGEHVFTDVYWDAPTCGLTEQDWWLRSRGGRWELKIPAGNGGRGTTAYKEVTQPTEIAQELTSARFLSGSEVGWTGASFLDEGVLAAAGFEVFATFRTNRTKFKLGKHTIDIDRASFGHQVIEIEAMSGPEATDISMAGAEIEALARTLGISREEESGRPVKGKLVTYILKNCPRQLEVLMRQRAEQASKSQQV